MKENLSIDEISDRGFAKKVKKKLYRDVCKEEGVALLLLASNSLGLI